MLLLVVMSLVSFHLRQVFILSLSFMSLALLGFWDDNGVCAETVVTRGEKIIQMETQIRLEC